MKAIGVLTSGGDAPGMNAAVRAVVRTAIYYGMKVYGIDRGYNGLIDGVMWEMDMSSVGDIIQRGGTILHTARCLEFKSKAGQDKAIDFIKRNGLEGMIVIGGDGSFMGAKVLTERGIPTIGIPGTIDNDLAYTDYTLGFDTAVNTVMEAVNKLRDTMTSHDRISVVEVMGRKCGDIALHSGISGGAECIIVPEVPFDLDEICDKLRKGKARGKVSSIIMLAEGSGDAFSLCDAIAEKTGYDCRATVLGHIQRGGSPTARDRMLGSLFGNRATKLLSEGKGGRVVGIVDNKIVDFDIMEALSVEPRFDYNMYEIANILSR